MCREVGLCLFESGAADVDRSFVVVEVEASAWQHHRGPRFITQIPVSLVKPGCLCHHCISRLSAGELVVFYSECPDSQQGYLWASGGGIFNLQKNNFTG